MGARDAHGCQVFPLIHQQHTCGGGAVGAAMEVARRQWHELLLWLLLLLGAVAVAVAQRRREGYRRHGGA
jgi:hypothetical protein